MFSFLNLLWISRSLDVDAQRFGYWLRSELPGLLKATLYLLSFTFWHICHPFVGTGSSPTLPSHLYHRQLYSLSSLTESVRFPGLELPMRSISLESLPAFSPQLALSQWTALGNMYGLVRQWALLSPRSNLVVKWHITYSVSGVLSFGFWKLRL